MATVTSDARVRDTPSYRRPALLVAGSLLLFVLLVFVLPSLLGSSPWEDHPNVVPASVLNPPVVWFFNIVIPVLGVVVFALLSYRCIKQRSLSWNWLFFIAGVCSFWVETVADWAIYLTYSPAFAHYQLPFDYPWHVHDNPFFMPFAYGLYWGIFPTVVLKLSTYASQRFGWTELRGLVLIGIPFGIVWDLLVEGTATYFGWWTYDPPLGPHFSWVPLGGNGIQTLVIPVLLMVIWPNLCAWMAGDPKDGTSPRIARVFGFRNRDGSTTGFGQSVATVHAQKSADRRWDTRLELIKVGAWISVFWWAQTTQLLPLVVVRYVFGHDSVFAPFPSWG